MYVCVYLFVCLSVSVLQTPLFNIKFWHRYLYTNISKWYPFIFFIFCLFWSYSPFLIFYYFLFFKATGQPIMKINTPNWSLETSSISIFILLSYDITIWRHKFKKLLSMVQVKYFGSVLDQQYYICVLLLLIEYLISKC